MEHRPREHEEASPGAYLEQRPRRGRWGWHRLASLSWRSLPVLGPPEGGWRRAQAWLSGEVKRLGRSRGRFSEEAGSDSGQGLYAHLLGTCWMPDQAFAPAVLAAGVTCPPHGAESCFLLSV